MTLSLAEVRRLCCMLDHWARYFEFVEEGEEPLPDQDAIMKRPGDFMDQHQQDKALGDLAPRGREIQDREEGAVMKLPRASEPPYRCAQYPWCDHITKSSCPRSSKHKPRKPESELTKFILESRPRNQFAKLPVVAITGYTKAGRHYVLLDEEAARRSAHDGKVRDVVGREYIWYSLGKPFKAGKYTFRYGYTASDPAAEAERAAAKAEWGKRRFPRPSDSPVW